MMALFSGFPADRVPLCKKQVPPSAELRHHVIPADREGGDIASDRGGASDGVKRGGKTGCHSPEKAACI